MSDLLINLLLLTLFITAATIVINVRNRFKLLSKRLTYQDRYFPNLILLRQLRPWCTSIFMNPLVSLFALFYIQLTYIVCAIHCGADLILWHETFKVDLEGNKRRQLLDPAHVVGLVEQYFSDELSQSFLTGLWAIVTLVVLLFIIVFTAGIISDVFTYYRRRWEDRPTPKRLCFLYILTYVSWAISSTSYVICAVHTEAALKLQATLSICQKIPCIKNFDILGMQAWFANYVEPISEVAFSWHDTIHFFWYWGIIWGALWPFAFLILPVSVPFGLLRLHIFIWEGYSVLIMTSPSPANVGLVWLVTDFWIYCVMLVLEIIIQTYGIGLYERNKRYGDSEDPVHQYENELIAKVVVSSWGSWLFAGRWLAEFVLYHLVQILL